MRSLHFERIGEERTLPLFLPQMAKVELKENSRKLAKDSSGIHHHLVWSVLVLAVANV